MCDCTKWHERDYKDFSNEEIVRQIDIMENLIDLDYIGDCILIDEILALLEVLKEECVRRVRINAV